MSYCRAMASNDEEEAGGGSERVWHINVSDDLASRPTHGAHSRCPLCGLAWEQVEKVTLDHVVPESMGGVDAERTMVCGPCNNRLGNELEGPLLGEQGCLLPFASYHGWAEGRLAAMTPDGEAYRWHPSTGDSELQRPSHKVDTTDPDGPKLSVSLPESLVGKLSDTSPEEALRQDTFSGSSASTALGE